MQAKLEAQYTAKRESHLSEVQDLKQQLEFKNNEVRSLHTNIDNLKSMNEGLKVLACAVFFVRALTGSVRAPSLPHQLALRAAKIWQKEPKTLSGLGKPSTCNSQSLTA